MPLILHSAPAKRVKMPLTGTSGFTPESGFSVSGALSDGGSIVISGTGFGTKSPAEPYLWAPMDGSITPSGLGTVTSWAETQNVAYASGEGVTGGAMKGTIKDGSGGETVWTARADASGFAWSDYGQKMYLFRRTKKNWTWSEQFNWKTFRTWPASADGTQPNFYMTAGSGGNGGIAVSPPLNVSSYCIPDNAAIWEAADVWLNEEILTLSNSGAGTLDGAFYYYVNGALKGDIVPADGIFRLKDTGSASIVQAYVVHGVEATDGNSGVVPEGGTYWADDVYLDRTWARVMIGNGSTFATSTVRDLCIPTAWSSTEITAVLRTGVHGSLSGKYLYVIDSSNTAIKIGSFN